MPAVFSGRRACVVALLGALCVAMTWPADAQQVTLASRAPRFLMVGKLRQGPVEVDVRRTAVLQQIVSLNVPEPTVARLFAEIGRQTGLRFGYSRDVLAADRRVALRADTITVAAALVSILMDTQLDVMLSSGRQITIVERAPRHTAAGSLVGRVTDTSAVNGVVSADAFLEGTAWRTTTDQRGWFRLEAVDSGTYTLVVRRPGYLKQSRRVQVREGHEDTVHVVLTPTVVPLDELVTTATGQQRRRDLGNAITTIRADSVMQSAPIRTLTDLLENRVPGMTVQHTSGAPGDPARLRLRGLGSVNRSNDPVVVVDGIRQYAAQANARSGNLTNAGLKPFVSQGRVASELPAPSPLDQIDPNTIEKVEVLKGPSAATLYGADAANGVIVITTKKGQPGPTVWRATYNHGRTAIPGRYPEGYFRFGRIPELGDAILFCPVVEVRCAQDSLVRFQALNDPDLTVLGQGTRNAFSLGASGGTRALTYSLTASYDNEAGVLQLPELEIERFRTRFAREAPDWMRKPHNLDRWSVASSVTSLLGPTLDVTLSTSLSRTEQQRSSLEHQLAPLAGTYIDRLSGYYYSPSTLRGTTQGGLLYALNPSTDVLANYYTRAMASSINFTTGLNANWRPRSWFTTIGRAGVNVISRDDQRSLVSGLISANDSGAVGRGTGRTLVSTFDLMAGVRKPLRWGFALETNLGVNLTTTHAGDLVTSVSGIVPGTVSINGAKTLGTLFERQEDLSVFGWYIEPRITGQRLSFSTGIRFDGGSAYGARVTSLLSLPKLNGSWVISEEPWFPFGQFFSSLRLRGAYGQAQTQPGVTDRLRLYATPFEGAGQWLDLDQIGNTNLRPERSVELEGGIDADMFDARVNLEVTGYVKNQVDAIMSAPVPGSVNGGGSIKMNIGNIRNTGVEVTLGLTPLRSPSATWTTQVNFARNVNTLVKLGPGVLPNPQQGLVAGYPVYSRWARPIVGFADANRDGVIERGEIQVGDDYVYMGRLQPEVVTSMHNNFSLFNGAVSVSAGFNYTGGAMQVDETARTNWVLARGLADPSASFLEQASVLALDSTNYGLTQSVSTFRFNSLSVNYRAPSRIARLIGASQLTVAVQGANLAMRSTYRGKDPDVMAWSAGENIIDTGQLPQPRTWQLSLFLQY